MTQTASLSSPGLHGPTGLGCSLATVTHGEGEGAAVRKWGFFGGWGGRQGFIRTVGALQRNDPPTYEGRTQSHARPIQCAN